MSRIYKDLLQPKNEGEKPMYKVSSWIQQSFLQRGTVCAPSMVNGTNHLSFYV